MTFNVLPKPVLHELLIPQVVGRIGTLWQWPLEVGLNRGLVTLYNQVIMAVQGLNHHLNSKANSCGSRKPPTGLAIVLILLQSF